MQIYKGDIVDFKGMGTTQKGMPHRYYHDKTVNESTVLSSVLLALCKQESYRQDSCQGN